MHPITILLPLLLIAAVFGPRFLRWRAALARQAELNTVRLIQEPILIRSEHPADAGVENRAHTIRTLLAESGNTWINPVKDVHVRVYHPNMGSGKDVRLSFANWRALVEQEYDAILARWARENQSINQEIRGAILGQN